MLETDSYEIHPSNEALRHQTKGRRKTWMSRITKRNWEGWAWRIFGRIRE
jgi:hypothetical protein